MSVAIVDLGFGNIGSVGQALHRLGAPYSITCKPAEILSAERVIMPGVGAAGFAMRMIDQADLLEVLKGLTQPALGICLGMHLLFEASDEGNAPGLGLIPGRVRKLTASKGHPVPHMGWCPIKKSSVQELRPRSYFYFAHSYVCDDGPATIATAVHGQPFPAAVRAGNWTGVQFHPERSGMSGSDFLKSFLA